MGGRVGVEKIAVTEAPHCRPLILPLTVTSLPAYAQTGYRLTYGGYDILALKTLLARGHIAGVSAVWECGKLADRTAWSKGEERAAFTNASKQTTYHAHPSLPSRSLY